MNSSADVPESCAICGNTFPVTLVVAGKKLRAELVAEICKTHPHWSPEKFICQTDLAVFRKKYVRALLESEKGELFTLEEDVLRSMEEHEDHASRPEADHEQNWTFGERLADKVASFGGSWAFLICYGIFLFVWILMNSLVVLWQPIDPYPYIFLNLVLSSLSALQAPFIMMSQNRQEAKDRLRSQHDYQVNLKAELEIRNLHEKVDHLLTHQWGRLVKIQELQLEMLAD
ncbi:MAG: DUF1003 domain-containing protein, partial [Pseudomonadota bacterium]